jgi:hypothetical protein
MLFALSIAVKMIVTALFFVGATFAAERGGPVVGGMIATLPISAGPAYVFLALDHDASFLAGAALASFVSTAATCVAALVFAVAAQRRGSVASIGSAFLVWLAGVALLQARPWTITSAVLVVAAVFAVCLVLVDRYRGAARPVLIRRWYDVPLRAAMVAILVALVIVLSTSLGPALTGFAACFPIVLMSRSGGGGGARQQHARTVGLRHVLPDPRCRGRVGRRRRRPAARRRRQCRLQSRLLGAPPPRRQGLSGPLALAFRA